MAKWGRNPSGGRPEFLPAEDIRLIGSPVFEMGSVNPNDTNVGIPPNAAMNVRRRGDFATDPPVGGAEEPAASAVGPTSGTLTGDVMAGLSPEDQAAVKAGLEGWMGNFNPDIQDKILSELPDYGKNTPKATAWTPERWRAEGYTMQPDGSWDIVTAPEPPSITDTEQPASPAGIDFNALANQGNQSGYQTIGGGGQNNQKIQGWGGGGNGGQGDDQNPFTPGGVYNINPNIGPGGTAELGPMAGPGLDPYFGVGDMAYRTDPFGVYTATRAQGMPYDPGTSTMAGYRSALGRGFQPTYGRYTLAPDWQGAGSFAEFLADPNRERAESDVLRQRFMDVAGQLTGRSEIDFGQQGRYAKFFDPNISENVGNNLVNAALASVGGPSTFDDALRTSLANRYSMYQSQDPNQTGMGAARRFADYVAGQYSPTWGQQGQTMGAASTAPAEVAAGPYDYEAASFQNNGAANGNAFNSYLNNGNLWDSM